MSFASKSITIATPQVLATAIKTSIATVAGVATYSGAGLNGSIGAGTMYAPRIISASLAAHAASYTAGSVITVTGTDPSDAVQTDTMTIVGTDGSESLFTTKFFKTVTSIAIAAQADTAGAFTFGVQDSFVPGQPIQLRVAVGGSVKLGYGDGSSDTITAVAIGEPVPVSFNRVYASSTAIGITCYIK